MQTPALSSRGLERRIKRHLTGLPGQFAAITTPGFEPYTGREIAALPGAAISRAEKGIVEFSGPFELVYAANLRCRTANRILLRIATFTVRSYPELYNKLGRINWELYVGFIPQVSFTVSSTGSRLHHTQHIAESAFSALRDYMKALGVTVGCDDTAPLKFFIRIADDICTLSIDSSGELLYKRGFRQATGRAPLRETTAAVLLAAVGWEKYETIADPCCGSGALIAEALLQVHRIQPGSERPFAFSSWPSFSKPAWEHLKKNVAADTAVTVPRAIYAADTDPSAVERVRLNCSRFLTDERLVIVQQDCRTFNSRREYGNRGLIISNLPYGKRIGVAGSSMDEFYAAIGRSFKKNCRGWDFAFLVADPQFERKSGLNGKPLLTFTNGGIRVRLVQGTVG
jgi:putative N6-adenine-specific DNA methylase